VPHPAREGHKGVGLGRDVHGHRRNGRAFDYRRNVLRFVVGSRVHDIGVYRPQHTWKFEGGIAFRQVDLINRNVPHELADYVRDAEKPKKE